MSVPITTSEPQSLSPARALGPLKGWLRSRLAQGLALVLAMGASAALAPFGMPAVLSLAVLCALGLPWLWQAEAGESAGGAAAGQPGAQQLSGHLTRQIVPVWRRNVEGARIHAEQSMSALAESFAAVASHLDQALQVGGQATRLDSGSIDELLSRHEPELSSLLDSTRRIAAVKNELLDGMTQMATTLADMVTLGKEVQTISRATHLLALNASAEAQRATTGADSGRSGSGFAVVAHEVRQLADQSRQAGAGLVKHLMHLQDKVQDLRRRGARLDTDEDELQLQADHNARAVLGALLRSIDEVARSQRSLHEAGHQVQHEVEQILVNLQSQDRMSQMLSSVTDDMNRLQTWLEGRADEHAVSASKWLERLESTYTMEEMRSSHHATARVEKATEVEFF
jgi:methyl-accepting chemotaxis protein